MSPLDSLRDTVRQLRAPNGCPWDKAQTLQSLAPCIIEEAYELVDALDRNCTPSITEEIGDALLHVVMLCEMGSETQRFSLESVAEAVTAKMIRRHPHVFGDETATTVEDVWTHWDSAKDTETPPASSAMDNIPDFPALLRAEKIQKKASRVGFDWPDIAGTLHKFDEEMREFKHELQHPNHKSRQEEEAGDLLFALVNVLRKSGIHPEEALRKANTKFISRFKAMEALSPDFETLPLNEKEALWASVKTQEEGTRHP